MHLIDDAAVAAAFDAFPDEARARLLELRALILDTAASIDGVGPLEETLRWGEPAYLTSTSGAGTTVRLGWKAARPDRGALLVNCRTTLIDTFRTLHPELAYEGNRAISFAIDAPLPEEALARCLTLALTYHRRRRP
ncbi:MAG: DUF1801 domain-containing protein [Pseudomonadales bacterium]|nr:DUF1801 domain-containing protein [Pseudomonadales bacterium]